MFPTHPRRLLLAGVSASALLTGTAAQAAGPSQFSAQWYAALAGAQKSAGSLAGARPPGVGATQSARSTANVAALTARLAQASAAQAAASMAALSHPRTDVADGLVAGGLQLAPNPTAATQFGAATPVQTSAAGRTQITVNQTSAQALLTWRTFNVGARTTLTFNQPNSQSVALNVVADPQANPSTILGQINANGRIYLLNPNGILFGAGSQVNVGGLVASAGSLNASYGTAAQFLATGLYNAADGQGGFLPTFTGARSAAPITVEAGASIQTPAPTSATVGGGLVLLHAGTVTNAGSISTPGGQTILAAGRAAAFRAGFSTGGNQTSTVLGTEAAVTQGGGSVSNAGVITSTLGDTTLVGHAVTQGGVILSTTSVGATERGTIHLLTDRTDATATVTLAPGSVTVIAPDAKAATAVDSIRTSAIAISAAYDALRASLVPSRATAEMNDYTVLSDRRDLSRIGIVAGGAVDFAAGSLTMAQGGQIAAETVNRVLIESGAALDVSGVGTAVVPQTNNVVTISVQTPNLADNPVSRGNEALRSLNISLDARQLISIATGAYAATGNSYTGGGAVLVPSGALAQQTHGIDEWLAVGGTVTLQAHVVASQTGSSVNLSGGSVTYAAGAVPQSYLVGTDGQLYNVNSAPASVAYQGVYSGFVENHPRWSVMKHFYDTLVTPLSINEPAYKVGRDGGVLNVLALPTTDAGGGRRSPGVLLNGAIESGIVSGTYQTAARTAGLTDGYAQPQSAVPLAASLVVGTPPLGTAGLLGNAITIGSASSLADTLTFRGALAAADTGTILLGAAALNADGLGGLRITTTGSIDVVQDVTLADGGTLSLNAPRVAVAGRIVARGGTISLADPNTPNLNLAAAAAADRRASILIGPAATLDVRGLFTNARLDPVTPAAGLARVNGGTVTIQSNRNVTLSPGSVIDVSGGAGISAAGKFTGGAGGSISVLGAFYPGVGALNAATTVAVGGTIRGYGVTGGGTLTVQADRIQVGTDSAAPARGVTVLDPSLFSTGFQNYVLDGGHSLRVADAVTLAPTVPVYIVTAQAPMLPTSPDPAQALQLTLLPLYIPNPRTAQISQRAGASLVLDASTAQTLDPNGTGFNLGRLSIGQNALLQVDPLQSITLRSYDQLTVDGTLSAHGGSISLLNTRVEVSQRPFAFVPGLSVWLGSASRLDASGVAFGSTDAAGLAFGVATAGGTVTIGTAASAAISGGVATDAAVITRAGSIIDVSGSVIGSDRAAGTGVVPLAGAAPKSLPVTLASSAGTIQIASATGFFLDGALRGFAGGAAVSGGTLALALDRNTFVVQQGDPAPAGLIAVRVPGVLRVTQTTTGALPTVQRVGQMLADNRLETGRISVEQINGGGFDAVSLSSAGVIAFVGPVSLSTARAVSLGAPVIGETDGAADVRLSAPVVTIASPPSVDPAFNVTSYVPIRGVAAVGTGTLDLLADLIRLNDGTTIGVTAVPTLNADVSGDPPVTTRVSYAAFGQVNLTSRGDIRIAGGQIATPGNITAIGQQITGDGLVSKSNFYGPITPGLIAGLTDAIQTAVPSSPAKPGSVLTIRGTGVLPAAPLSAQGAISFIAATIDQGGIIRSPEGTLSFTGSTTLEPGSITSVSASGLAIPFGGTSDGQTYTYGTLNLASLTTQPGITFSGNAVAIRAGAVVDLSGGGELTGVGFVPGLNIGSVDALTTPLIAFNPATRTASASSITTAPVYAVLPSYSSPYAPANAPGYAAVPLGAQITLTTSIPGLPAGTYTLLPANYALLPGGFRIQLGAATAAVTPTTARSDGSYAGTATVGVANTALTTPLPVAVTLAPGTVTRTYGAYDEESLSSFIAAYAIRAGLPRTTIVADTKALDLQYFAPDVAAKPGAVTAALRDDGTILGAPAAGGRGETVTIGVAAGARTAGQIEVTAPGSAGTAGDISIDSAQIGALGAQRLVIGDVSGTTINTIDQSPGGISQIVVRAGATLSAAELIIAAAALGAGDLGVTIESGATLSTIGRGAPPFDGSNGYFYQAYGTSAIVLSNGQLTFLPYRTRSQQGGPIVVQAGAALLTEGTLTFQRDNANALLINSAAVYGARDLILSAADISIGSAATLAAAGLAGTLPSGLQLTQERLRALLAGDPALGVPALASLSLTASDRINLYGSVSLSAGSSGGTGGGGGLQTLALTTPAVFGAGGPSDVATISTGTLYLDGLLGAGTVVGGNTLNASQLPGAAIAGGPGTGTGRLSVTAGQIVIGASPTNPPLDRTPLNRLIEGFVSVDLTASQEIVGNHQGTLSVYALPGTLYGGPGLGGQLTMTTPLLTASAGSSVGIVAGGAVTVATAPSTGAAATGYGAQITLAGDTVAIDSRVTLPGGRLTVKATHDLMLGDAARIDVSTTRAQFFDQSRAVPGGTVMLDSLGGNVTATAASSIALGSDGGSGGTLEVTATSGTVSLAGAISGGATSLPGTGGLYLRADTLLDVAGLNDRLNTGLIGGSRRIEAARGDIVLGGVVTAQTIDLSADSGSLTVTGTLDAHGANPGTIRLSAGNTLEIGPGATLDVHETALHTDSRGGVIGSENTGHVELTSSDGGVVIGGGVAIDAASPDGVARGILTINARRAGSDNVAIAAPLPVSLTGVAETDVVAWRSYGAGTDTGTAGANANISLIAQADLDTIDQRDTQPYMAALLAAFQGKGAAAGNLAGLAAGGVTVNLRPGVEIASAGTIGVGDIDLHTYRYAGQPGVLRLRAAGDLVFNGSLTDGFGAVPRGSVSNPDEQGWIITNRTQEPYGQNIVIPLALDGQLALRGDTTLQNSATLNYDIPIAAGSATIGANAVIPQDVVLASGGGGTFTSQATATADILDPTGAVLFAANTLIPAGTTLATGDTLRAGSVLPFAVTLDATTWKAGNSLSLFTAAVTLAAGTTTVLPGGALIPAGSVPVFIGENNAHTYADGSTTAVNLRGTDANGNQGLIYATASLLAPVNGKPAPSWSYQLVSGANLGAADGRTVQAPSALGGGGNMTLADTHYTTPFLGVGGTNDANGNPTGGLSPSFSVIRTGTGSIDIASGGSFIERSLYGVYTAGAATRVEASAQPARGNDLAGDGTPLSPITGAPAGGDYNQFIATSAFNYPDGGGDFSLHAQGNISGAVVEGAVTGPQTLYATSLVSNWLWRLGSQGVTGVTSQNAAWGINFGTYIDINAVSPSGPYAARPVLVGFTGLGTLGGGNVDAAAGGDAGVVTPLDQTANSSSALTVVVAGTGRVTAVERVGGTVVGGTLAETGGGSLSLRVTGAINRAYAVNPVALTDGGVVADLRGPATVAAGSIGFVPLGYGAYQGGGNAPNDVRPNDPFVASPAAGFGGGGGGFELALGDSVASITTLGDLVLENVVDPGRVTSLGSNAFEYTAAGGTVTAEVAGLSAYFSLWAPATAVSLLAAGGNVTPNSALPASTSFSNNIASDQRFVYPASLEVTAASADIILANGPTFYPIELAPSAHGTLDLLAGTSIFGSTQAIDMSGAAYDANSVSNPFKPIVAFATGLTGVNPAFSTGAANITAPNSANTLSNALFAYAPDSANSAGHAADGVPARAYAAGGDVVNLDLGEVLLLPSGATDPTILYLAATPAVVQAARDIVNFGIYPSVASINPTFQNTHSSAGSQAASSGSLFLNRAGSDVSVLRAGRDVVTSTVYVAGGGALSIEAGRNVAQGDLGQLKSLGPVYSIDPANRNTGASIAVTAGSGAAMPDYGAIESAYLPAAKLADPAFGLTAPQNAGRVAHTYTDALVSFLVANYGYTGAAAGARAFLDALSAEQRDVFLRQVYLTELVASGRESSEPASARFHSYARGKQAIATLFPSGQPYAGDVTFASGFVLPNGSTTVTSPVGDPVLFDAGIATQFGGDIQVLAPGGQVVLGQGTTGPGPGTGFITFGRGNIDVYASGNQLLDLSRIFTTFGGDIALWSAQGNISAGNGSKTTLVFQPPAITYDQFGAISIAPSVPSSGAGIATLAPIPGVPAGNIDLIAPVGTIDAGEAGIRVSGNLNLAAAAVANAANVQVQGKTTGAPTVAVANVGALSAAAAAAGSATNQAQQAAQRQAAGKPASSGSIITVEVVSNGS